MTGDAWEMLKDTTVELKKNRKLLKFDMDDLTV